MNASRRVLWLPSRRCRSAVGGACRPRRPPNLPPALPILTPPRPRPSRAAGTSIGNRAINPNPIRRLADVPRGGGRHGGGGGRGGFGVDSAGAAERHRVPISGSRAPAGNHAGHHEPARSPRRRVDRHDARADGSRRPHRAVVTRQQESARREHQHRAQDEVGRRPAGERNTGVGSGKISKPTPSIDEPNGVAISRPPAYGGQPRTVSHVYDQDAR